MKVSKKKAVTAGFFVATVIGSIMFLVSVFKDIGKFDDNLDDEYEYF